MRHLRKGRKFGRVAKQRRALMRTMATSFFIAGSLHTTRAKANELRPWVERFLTRGKDPSIATRRYLGTYFSEGTVVRIVAMAHALGARQGGYTRIIKSGVRKRDSAQRAILQLVK